MMLPIFHTLLNEVEIFIFKCYVGEIDTFYSDKLSF
jgi:hypothetical protein